MGIYIKNEIMPVGCYECKARRDVNIGVGIADGCMLLKQLISNVIERHPDCPMVGVPEHGRLVDADAFSAEMRERQEAAMEWKKEAKDSETAARADAVLSFLSEVKLTLDKLPTVIPEEGA